MTQTNIQSQPARITFEAEGMVEVERDKTWSWLIDHITDEIQKDIDHFDLREFHCEVVDDTAGVEYYNWEAEGVVMADG